jgi:hypothetical protein
MMFEKGTSNLESKLKNKEKQELVEYCKSQGFTEKETEVFVKNSLEKLYAEI